MRRSSKSPSTILTLKECFQLEIENFFYKKIYDEENTKIFQYVSIVNTSLRVHEIKKHKKLMRIVYFVNNRSFF